MSSCDAEPAVFLPMKTAQPKARALVDEQNRYVCSLRGAGIRGTLRFGRSTSVTALYLDGKADERTCAVLESGSKQRRCKGSQCPAAAGQ